MGFWEGDEPAHAERVTKGGLAPVFRNLLARLFGQRPTKSAMEGDRLQAEIAAIKRLGAARSPAVPPSFATDRREWQKAPASRDTRWHSGDMGQQASFTYVDVDGVVTDRVVTNWLSDGAYIKAFCTDRRALRTFRKDRIEDWRV